MRSSLLLPLVALWMLIAPSVDASTVVEPGPAVATAAEDAHDDHGDHDHGEEVAPKAIFDGLFGHLVPHGVTALWIGGDKGFGFVSPYKTDAAGEYILDSHGHKKTFYDSAELTAAMQGEYGGGSGHMIYNINTVQWIAGILLVLVMLSVAKGAKASAGGAPKGVFYGMMESLILFVRDEMVYAVMGKHHGKPLVPIFLTQFFFILFLNIFGLVPDIFHTGVLGTATANLMVTAAMAITTVFVIHGAGIKEFGVGKHFANFVPHVPVFVLPIIVPVEIIGLIVKPVALTLRLFANLTAGHLVVLGLFGLIQLAGTALGTGLAGWGAALPVMALATAINCLELFVAFVQAYIFTYLSIVFVGASLHPDH